MKSLIIYESVCHGNTEKIAKAMSESLNADLIKINQVTEKYLMNYDLIGFGSGIFYGKLHKNVLGLIDKLPNVSNKKAFVFSTSGQGKIEFNNIVKQNLSEKGFEVIGSFACKGYDTFGPFKLIGGIAKNRPDDNDIKMAKNFVEKLTL